MCGVSLDYEHSYYGRVMSLVMMAFGSQALLAPLWGLLADTIGVRPTLVIVGAATASITALVELSWHRNRHTPRPDPAPTTDSMATDYATLRTRPA